MNLKEQVQQAVRRVSNLAAGGPAQPNIARKTEALPAVLGPWRPRNGDTLPKATPANLRKFAETPVPRRAINCIKDRIAAMDWQVRLKRGMDASAFPEAAQKIASLTLALQEPNASDSFRSLLEPALEDALVGGFGAIEMQTTGDAARPVELWPVDGATIRVNVSWDGDPSVPRYAQATGKLGTQAMLPLRDDELIYIRLNPRSYTPFGLGRLEVAFETVNSFWWQDEIEGTGRVPVLSTENKPEVLRFAGGTDADLRLGWQQFLLRMIANAFDLPPMYLGLENDVNKNTASEMADEAFSSVIAPTAKLVAEHLTRDLIAKKLGWSELEFVFNDLEARDGMEQLQIQTQLLQAGVLTVDEVRAMRGLGPLGEQLLASSY
jgi:hypothetical protein